MTEDLKTQNTEVNLFQVNLAIVYKNNQPCIEIRKLTSDPTIIKNIISCAFHNKPVIVLPTFSDKIKALNSLIEKGIIYKKNKEDGSHEFHFNI